MRTSTTCAAATLVMAVLLPSAYAQAGAPPAEWPDRGVEKTQAPYAESATTDAPDASSKPGRWRRTWDDGLLWRTLDEKVKLRLGAYVLYDGASIGQDNELEALGAPGSDDFEVRDFQIDLRGRLYKGTQFVLQYDINDGKFDLKDNYLMWEDVSQVGTIQLGHFKEPFGLEHLSSFRHIPFMERSLADALMPNRGVGVMARNTARRGRLAWALGAFYETDTVDNISDSRAFALTGRVSGLPIYRDGGEELLHVGLAITQRALDAPVRLKVRPEANLAPRYLDTGDFSANSLSILNLEAAYLRGPLQLQAEFAYMFTSGSVLREDATLNDVADEIAARLPRLTDWLAGRTGWQRPSDSILWNIPFDLMARGEPQFFSTYAQASYVLTGETRLYNQSRGLFGPVIPENPVRFRQMRGTGAWEVSARLSHIDLNDAFIAGGRETNLTVGLNWYLNKRARIMVNYVHGEVERDSYEGSFDALQTRFQLDFQTQALNDYVPVQMMRRRTE